MPVPILRKAVPGSRIKKHATRVYLVGLCVALFLPSFLPDGGIDWPWKLLVRSFLVVSASLFLVRTTGKDRIWWFGLIILGSMILTYAPLGLPTNIIYVSDIATLVMFVYSLIWLFRTVLTPEEVDEDTILAAVCAYLALGFIASLLCSVLERNIPGSFVMTTDASGGVDLEYFSFVSLSTLGFGDIVPTNAKARSLTVMITLVGQLYLAVVIASLVGKFLIRKRN